MELASLVAPFVDSAFIALFPSSRRAAAMFLVIWAGASLANPAPAEGAASRGRAEEGVQRQLTDWLTDPQADSLHFGTACTPIRRWPAMPAALGGPVASPMLLAPIACDLLNAPRLDATDTAPAIVSLSRTVAPLTGEVRWQMSYKAANQGGIPASGAVVAFALPVDLADGSAEPPTTPAADCSLDGECGTRATTPSNGADEFDRARFSAGPTQGSSAWTLLSHVLWPILLFLLALAAGWSLKRWFSYDKALLRAARAGLRRGEFHVEYQPIVDIRRALCVGVEAFLRWDNRKYGAQGPAHYLEFIENSSLLDRMTRFVVSRAAQDLREIGAPKSLYVGITAPVSYLLDSGFTADRTVVGSHGFPPLILNVSASSVRMFKKRLTPMMTQAREKRVRFALSGVRPTDCELALPTGMTFEIVKIDREVLGLDPDERAKHLDALTRMGHDFGAAVVVEGVEHSAHHKLARASRAEFGQGFFYSRALDATGLKVFLETANAPPSNRAGAATVLGWRVRHS
ncbi:diguanylate phosphodiesterase [Caballeronia ptereochthonis]|uniref:Diguanylate phosphodiesterase n=2 Tax=Caballeronia ptereochthonis TaxID=1777144 RepID=A0A158AXX2_9BURK|nr:diguanylate phosphodiesterase [Caballeronia ptereochthonis]